MNKFKWTEVSPHSDAVEAVELIGIDGSLCGVTLRTTINAWGQYDTIKRKILEQRIVELLNDYYVPGASPKHDARRASPDSDDDK